MSNAYSLLYTEIRNGRPSDCQEIKVVRNGLVVAVLVNSVGVREYQVSGIYARWIATGKHTQRYEISHSEGAYWLPCNNEAYTEIKDRYRELHMEAANAMNPPVTR